MINSELYFCLKLSETDLCIQYGMSPSSMKLYIGAIVYVSFPGVSHWGHIHIG